MMNENDYLLAWAAYGVAALGCLLVWMRLTSWMWRYLREPLRVIVAVLLFGPTSVDASRELFAPAIAVTAMDMLLKVGNNAWRAAADLTLYCLIALSLYLVFVAIRWPIERWLNNRRQAKSQDDPRTLSELLEDADEHYPAAAKREAGGRREPRI